MKINLDSIRKSPRIEMLPLIDIVFLLLVVFIYAMLSMAVHRGMDVDLPIAGSAEIDRDNHLSVTLQAAEPGQPASLFIGKEQYSIQNFADELLSRADGNLDKEILIFADKTVSYEEVFKVLDAMRTIGLHQVSLQSGIPEE